MSPTREHVEALVRAVQARAAELMNAPHRRWLKVSLGDPDVGVLVFGSGYFDGDKCLWYGPGDVLIDFNLSVADGVDKFLKTYGLE